MLPFFKFLFIGCCALALLTATRSLYGLPLALGPLGGFVFGGVIFGYYCTHPGRQYRVVAWGLGLAGSGCFVFWVKNSGEIFAVAVPVLLWLAYYGFRRPGNAGLRTWLFLKPLTVAVTWAWVTVFLPLPTKCWSDALLLFSERSAFVFALALAYDVSDLIYDQRYGLTTLVHRLERKSTFLLINIGLLCTGLCIFASWAFGLYNTSQSVSLIVSLLLSSLWIRFLLKKESWKPWQKVLIDGLMLLQSALVLLLH